MLQVKKMADYSADFPFPNLVSIIFCRKSNKGNYSLSVIHHSILILETMPFSAEHFAGVLFDSKPAISNQLA
jgi:hypothetical protein